MHIICGGSGNKTITIEDLHDLLNTVIKQNNDLKTEVVNNRKIIEKQNENIRRLEGRVLKLETENETLREKFEVIQRERKRNNIVIFGVDENKNIPLVDIVKGLFSDKLNLNIENTDFKNIYRIGKVHNNNKKPIVIEIVI